MSFALIKNRSTELFMNNEYEFSDSENIESTRRLCGYVDRLVEIQNTRAGVSFPSLDRINRPAVDTATAAHFLNRSQQTLRIWACTQTGPLKPRRVNGRLAWPVADIRRLLGAAE